MFKQLPPGDRARRACRRTRAGQAQSLVPGGAVLGERGAFGNAIGQWFEQAMRAPSGKPPPAPLFWRHADRRTPFRIGSSPVARSVPPNGGRQIGRFIGFDVQFGRQVSIEIANLNKLT